MERNTTERPEIVTDDHLYFLDVLRQTGVTNMFGAGSYLRDEYPELSRSESNTILKYWMETFGNEER